MPEAPEHRLHQGIVAAPPALVAAQRRSRSDIAAKVARSADDFGESRRIEQSQVHALARKRMHDVSGVAGQRDTIADIGPRMEMA